MNQQTAAVEVEGNVETVSVNIDQDDAVMMESVDETALAQDSLEEAQKVLEEEANQRAVFTSPEHLLKDFVFNAKGLDGGGGGSVMSMISEFRGASIEHQFNEMKAAAQSLLNYEHTLLVATTYEQLIAEQAQAQADLMTEQAIKNAPDSVDVEVVTAAEVLDNLDDFPDLKQTVTDAATMQLTAIDEAVELNDALIDSQVNKVKADALDIVENPMRHQRLMQELKASQARLTQDGKVPSLDAVLEYELAKNQQGEVAVAYDDIKANGLNSLETHQLETLNSLANTYADVAGDYAVSAQKGNLNFKAGLEGLNATVVTNLETPKIDVGEHSKALSESVERMTAMVQKLLASLGLG